MPGNFSYVVPGKLAGCAKPGGWGDPRSDLGGLARRGIGALVSLTEEELDPDAVRDVGLKILHLPIPDFHPPTRKQIEAMAAFIDERLAEGVAVAIHCGAGIGRTGTMLACYLVHTGLDAAEAVRKVRAARPGSVETAEQLRSIEEYARSLGRGKKHPARKGRDDGA